MDHAREPDLDRLTLPADMLETFLAEAPRLAREVAELLEPVSARRDDLRAALSREIVAVPEPPDPMPSLGAVDGGFVVEQLYAADRLVVGALVAEGLNTPRTGELHHSAWTTTQPHQHDLDRLATAAMICQELKLLHGISYQLRIFDGSHQTPVIALNSALSSANPFVRWMAADLVQQTDAIDALVEMCDDHRGQMIVGLPKSDPSTEFCQQYGKQYGLDLPPVTDRFLATLILERGQMLRPRKTISWRNLHILHRREDRENSDGERELDPRRARLVRETAKQLNDAIGPLRQAGQSGQGVGITYLKPHRADTVIKIEYKASLTRDFGARIASILSGEILGPHMLEPYAQFVADLWAKNIATAAAALGASTRNHLPPDSEWSRYLLLGYRTSGEGGHA
jgi:hypothetical protein